MFKKALTSFIKWTNNVFCIVPNWLGLSGHIQKWQLPHCFSMQAIQDMNNLKRLIRQAEMSHYALFRCCLFLQSCGNGDVLLQNARAEHSTLPEACSIINVLEEHAQGTLNWQHSVTVHTLTCLRAPWKQNSYWTPSIIAVWFAF